MGQSMPSLAQLVKKWWRVSQHRTGWDIRLTQDPRDKNQWYGDIHGYGSVFKITAETVKGAGSWGSFEFRMEDPLFFAKLSKVLGFVSSQNARHRRHEGKFWEAEKTLFEEICDGH